MTFYWWSHWFWITLLSTSLLPILFVHTYPSHDIALEYKNDNSNNNNDDDKNSKAVTKLYQTTTKIIWATTLPPIHSDVDETMPQARTKLTNIPITLEHATDATATDADNLQLPAVEAADRSDSVDYEFKRSTDENKSNKTMDETDGTIPQLAEEQQPQQQNQQIRQNDSNTKESSLLDQISLEKSLNSSRQEKELKDFSINHNSSNSSSTTTSKTETMKITAVQNGSSTLSSSASTSLSTPSQPQIANNAHLPVEWLNSRTLATPDHVADEEETTSLDGQKVPFTLENVNKEDEILRAENEHRSRKSKVLSAEYNHINRFINFSTDSKNLLTRSASSAPNDYDGDDGNISSEALAIKRTYFLDASAISAICFTVFGVCCTVGTLGIVLYRRRFLNKPQALSEPDSSVYIDDSTMRVSDNSDEMYSLDNDSFLNSLEAMTIQNYWTDTVKHTKL